MKLRLSKKYTALASILVSVVVLGSIWASLIKSDPILEEIEAYAGPADKTEQELCDQMAAIRAGQNVNVANAEGYTPLMNAARTGKLNIIDFLLIKGARLHRKGPNQLTAEMMAANSEIAHLLRACILAEQNPQGNEKAGIERKLINAHISTDDLTKALFQAVQSTGGNSLELTAHVLALGGNANAINAEGKHILEIRHRNPGSIVLLLRHGSDPNAVLDAQGGSAALCYHVGRNQRNVQNLLDANANVKGANALAKAAGIGDSALVNKLIERGANPNGIAANGKSVLEHAVQGLGNPHGDDALAGIVDSVRILLTAGASPERTTKEGKKISPLSPGGISILPECIRLLVDAGADVNATNSRGANYAHIAAYKKATPRNLELLQDIIAAGADLSHVDNKGETFLFYALPSMCGLPVADPDENIREEAEDILEEMFDIINDAEPNPSALDRNGNTALHLAVICRGTADDKVVEFLLQMGVDPGVRNKFGRTALEAMLRNPCGPRSKYIAHLLAQRGPLPSDAGLQLVLAAMLDDTAAIRKLLDAGQSRETMAVALGCVQNATAADLLLKAGAPGYYDNMEYMVRHGNPDVVRIFAMHNRLRDLASHWDSVRTEAMAKAFVEAGLLPSSPSEIANERVLKYLLSLPEFSQNGTRFDISAWRNGENMLEHMVKNGRKKMTRMLLEHGAAVNGHLESLIALTDDKEIAEMLIESGADLTQKSSEGDTLLSLRKQQLKKLALGYLESPTPQEKESFRSHYAIAELLKENGVSDVHPRRNEIKRALQRGDRREDFETVEFVTPDWSGPVRISEDAMVMARASGNDDTANILSIGPDKIRFKWDRWSYGYVVRKPDGKFYETTDEDRYRDLKKNPLNVPHFYLDYIDAEAKKSRIYMHPDLNYAVHADSRQCGKITKLSRGRNGQMTICWDNREQLELIEHQGQMHVLDANTAKQLLKGFGVPIHHKELELVDKAWQDTIRISTNFMVAARKSYPCDTANILQFNDERITLKWDRWRTQTFVKQDDGKYHVLQAEQDEQDRIRKLIREGSREINVKRYRFSSTGWHDVVLISFKHKVAVRSGGHKDSASVLHYDKDSITVKWDRWGEETFVRQADGSYRASK